MSRRSLCLLVLLLLTLVSRAWVALADPRSLIASDVLLDDSFYYLKIARNFLDGRGLSFDGTVATNGFQPLFFLLLLPILKFAPRDAIAPIHGMECLLAGCAVLTTAMLYVLGRRLHGRGTGLVLAALGTVSPALIAHGMNGLETGLALLLALVAAWSFLREVPANGCPTAGGAVRFGLLLGLAFLARVDLGMLAAACFAVAAFRALRSRSLASFAVRWSGVGLAFAVVVAPWCWFSHRECGAMLPQSGTAGRQIALHYGWANLTPIWPRTADAPLLFPPQTPPTEWTADVATQWLAVFAHEHPLLAGLRADSPFSVFPNVRSSVVLERLLEDPRALLAFGLVVVALCGLPAVLSRRRSSPGLGAVASGFVLACAGGYIFYAPVHWYFPRYLLIPAVLSTVAVVAAYAALFDRRGLRSLGVVLALLLVGSQAVLWRGGRQHPLLHLQRSDAKATGFLAAWNFAHSHIPENKVLGAFQAGTYAWFGDRDVINLDGKVDPRAAAALQENRLHEYLAERGVELVFDWEWVFHCLCGRFLDPAQQACFRPVLRGRHAQEPTLLQVRSRALRKSGR